MPEVTVVIPACNNARFLGETIQSVLDQTFQDFELIRVYDDSTDSSREAVAGFKDPRIKYLYQESRGVSAACNNGLKFSSGKYIYFLSSDHMLLKDTLEKSVSGLEKYPEVGFGYGQAWIMQENGQVYGLRKSSFKKTTGFVDRELQIREPLYIPMITTSTVMAKRE